MTNYEARNIHFISYIVLILRYARKEEWNKVEPFLMEAVGKSSIKGS